MFHYCISVALGKLMTASLRCALTLYSRSRRLAFPLAQQGITSPSGGVSIGCHPNVACILARPAEVLESSRFDDFDSFMAAVQALWDKQWAAVHAAPRYGAHWLSGGSPPWSMHDPRLFPLSAVASTLTPMHHRLHLQACGCKCSGLSHLLHGDV
jgi:hypothetical protein